MSDLYRIKVGGEWCEWDGMESIPWHDVLQVVGSDVFRESNRIVIEPVDAERREPTVEELEELAEEWRDQIVAVAGDREVQAENRVRDECAADLEELIDAD